MTPTGMEQTAKEIYETKYVAGNIKTHDGDSVIFFRDRFEHAFFRVERVGNQKKSMIPESGVKTTISERERFEVVDFAEYVVDQVL